MKRVRLMLFFVLCFTLSAVAVPSLAQTTRADQISEMQEEKSEELAPYKPNKAEEWLKRIQDWGLLTAPRGVYPFIGSAYSGGGLALGAGYRTHYSDYGFLDFHGAWSISNYRMLDGTFRLPDFGAGTVQSRVNAHYIHANKVTFFGLGNDSLEADETSFLYNPTTIDYRLTLRAHKRFRLGGQIGYEMYEIGQGEKPNVPSIEEVFDPISAPGLGTNPDYRVGGVFLEFDTRQSPGYTTSGVLYSVEWLNYSETGDLNQDFQRLDAQALHFIPILRANQVIALRALASFTDPKDGNEIPFFLLPKLGGGNELRGFRDFRFRDRHRLLLTAEYRWTPSKFVDMALFYETGKVASRSENIDFNDLHDCYGFGIRFHTPAAVPLRIEIAHSEEGNRLIFSGGTAF